MNLVRHRLIAALSTLVTVACWAAAAPAQIGQPQPGATLNTGKANLPSPNLTLLRTRINSRSDTLSFSTTPVAAFPTMNIACPASPGSCTLRIEISSQFGSVDAGTAAVMDVQVGGSGLGILPGPVAGVSINSSAFFAPATMTFVKNVAPGNHAVSVRFKTTSGAAGAGFRTLTVSMFTP